MIVRVGKPIIFVQVDGIVIMSASRSGIVLFVWDLRHIRML